MSRKRSILRIFAAAVFIVTGLYLIAFAGLTLFQRKLMYYPCQATRQQVTASADAAGFKAWLNPGGELMGWYRPDPQRPGERQILLLHGNAGCARDWFYHADRFQELGGFDFYILEYPGYGSRPGHPTQTNLISAAEEGFQNLRERCSVYLIGESLGTGVACWLAGSHPRDVRGVFLVAPYPSLTAVAQSHLPLFPVKWMLKDEYPANEWLTQYHGPLAVLLGGDDRVIPSEFGQALFDGYTGPKKIWTAAGASHDVIHRPSAELCKQVAAFWQAAP